jgi:hypothetical protein
MAEEEKKESDLKEEIIELRERIAHQEGRKEGENWRWQRIGLIVAAAGVFGVGTLILIVNERAATVQHDIINTIETGIIGTAESRQAEIINAGATREAENRLAAESREAEIRLAAETRQAEIINADATREAEIRAAVAATYATEFNGFQTSVAKSNDEMTSTRDALMADFSTAVFEAAIQRIPQGELIELSTNLISSRLDQLDLAKNLEQSFVDRVEANVYATSNAIEMTATAAAPISTPTAPSTP